ncbi:phenylalanyl-tRNA synthetase [Neoconidiobolus thromboides FSU 785]|nr:phenylalanyl-tRNA synthetase [Neoconidiobolus thromboides FSU 785]
MTCLLINRVPLIDKINKNRLLNLIKFSSKSIAFELKNETTHYKINEKEYIKDEYSNINNNILQKIEKRLHNQHEHPIKLIKDRIQANLLGYQHFNDYTPIVKTTRNFDDLLVKKDHPGRSKSDSFYFNKDYMLRTHTTTNEIDVYKLKEVDKFTICADVYRRDEVDKNHYPIFHQLEVVHLFNKEQLEKYKRESDNQQENNEKINNSIEVEESKLNLNNLSSSNGLQKEHNIKDIELVTKDLKTTVNQMLFNLFGKNQNQKLKIRWIEAYFPFTSPSWEVEIYFNNQWLEVMGCGILKQEILDRNERKNEIGWASGFGIERLSMVLYNIQDIRLFWSEDSRFLNQFKNKSLNDSIQFQPFSKLPPCIKDITFWINNQFEENDFSDLVREIAGDLVESVELIDSFKHPKTNRESKCYRIIYRSMDRNVTNEEINSIQEKIRSVIEDKLNVELR